MALSNMYKPQTNKFLHLESDEGDFTEDELDDELDDTYSKNFSVRQGNSKSGVQKPLMTPNTKTKIRRKHTKPWCTTKSCLACFMWLAFFSICVVGLVLLILRAIDSADTNLNKQLSNTKTMIQGRNAFYTNDENIEACDNFKVKKVWHATLPKLMTETAVRLNDVNGDGIKDIIISFSTGVDGYKAPRVSCDLYFNGTYPCFGGALALDGSTGKELWRHYSMHEIYALNCNGDLDGDGTWDCLLGGRGGAFQAISGNNGKLLWNMGEQAARDENMNFYTAQFIQDLDGDGVLEVLAAHGGDPLAEPNSPIRLKGRLIIFSGKTGKVLRWIVVPDEREIYFSPVLYHKKDGTDMVIFGTGGETHPGGLWVISLMDLYLGIIETAQQIYEDKFKGVMTPPVLVDLNKDGTVDIVTSMYNTTVAAFDGETYRQIWNYSFAHSESYSTPGAGFYNDDDIPDIMVRYNYGPGFPVYYYSLITILDGKTGQPLIKPFKKSSVAVNSSPLSVSMEGFGNDLFIYWMADCKGHEGDGKQFSFVEGTNVHEQSRADTCQLRYNTKSFSKLNIMNRKTGFPGKTIYYSDEFWGFEHKNGTILSKSDSKDKNSPSSRKKRKRHKRHIGVPDHGGFQRIIATGGLAPSLQAVNSQGPANSIDVVFTTYWQYPAKVRVILPEDKACINHYRKLAKEGKFSNKVNTEENEKHGMYDAGDAAVNICLKKHEATSNKNKFYTSQADFDWYKVHFGSLTVYRFQISCECKKKKCSRFLPMIQQGWGGYMGTLGNSYYLSRNRLSNTN